MAEPLLSVRNLKCHYMTGPGVVRAVDGIDLDVGAGEIVGIVGESGSGKSTLALSVLGLLDRPGRIVEGTISFKGNDLQALSEDGWRQVRGRRISMIFQSPEASFSPTATIGRQMTEVLRVHRGMNGHAAKAAAEHMLTKVGMPRPAKILESYPFELSGGMCQRAALALAISLQPELLLADEPTVSLDLLAQAEITQLLMDMRHQYQLAMIIISHDLGLVSRMADRVVIMYAGRIVESGPAIRVLQSPRHPYTQALLASIPQLEAQPRAISALPGRTPDMTAPVTGCTFFPRCDKAGERCSRAQPPLVAVEVDQLAACWMQGSGVSVNGDQPRTRNHK
ncbi:peptide/nickel transport system ATP-binding protein [Nitrosospira sp. Nl5]|uniref:ABC transporter ATP-binding protein n=1 Tax=Nitrosospira sp. Nl5 TaxID=200120 RepID=UPI000886DD2F|nr:ABC transporter ATP-binding protein [Nitrosospira sp. Nl5]SCY03551.1 peptide/nickel transport system ATP-binding protein [Nitrosospira sp. Nl5]